MIRSLIGALILLFSIKGFARSDYYPGMVQLVTDAYVSTGPSGDLSKLVSNTIVFSFYKQRGDSQIARELSFYFDWANIPRKVKVWEDDYNSWFSPMSGDTSDLDYYLTCKSRNGDWVEVVVNEKTKETLWLKNSFHVRFISWDKINKRKRWVKVKANTTIYGSRDTSSAKLIPEVNCFQIDRVKGDWMKLSTRDSELCGCNDQNVLKNVWIRYRTRESLLIEVNIQ